MLSFVEKYGSTIGTLIVRAFIIAKRNNKQLADRESQIVNEAFNAIIPNLVGTIGLNSMEFEILVFRAAMVNLEEQLDFFNAAAEIIKSTRPEECLTEVRCTRPVRKSWPLSTTRPKLSPKALIRRSSVILSTKTLMPDHVMDTNFTNFHDQTVSLPESPHTMETGISQYHSKDHRTPRDICIPQQVGMVSERSNMDSNPSSFARNLTPLKHFRQWILDSQQGYKTSLRYEDNVQIPTKESLGTTEVLVKLYAASLNYRDIVIAGSSVGFPLCDGSGLVEAVGSSVQSFKPGDRVITFPAPDVVSQRGSNSQSGMADVQKMLGLGTHGTLRSHGVFSESALVHAPESLDWLQAATLPVTWLTAWNALSYLKDSQIGPDTWILVQGTGGVSIAMLQLASSFGLTVVATTSSEEKAAKLMELGARHVINYRENPLDWGKKARALTPGGVGFDMVVDIGGNETLGQSLEAIRPYGSIQIVGAVGQETEVVPMIGALMFTCTIRGFLMGSQSQFDDLVRFIDEKKIQPFFDNVVFELADAKDAYKRLEERKHFAKVVVRVCHNES
ncbi:alcohol dehydrogenase [Fusarium heterosporum]|uniref:Alcohol dehydrogenase n=1 Tax=Fusarium heterosporum TaxID=42747 RepID=A0A8H5WNQ7_FUSHE|nr:alcohol dehydrogenase [Fusarium heterosporum]